MITRDAEVSAVADLALAPPRATLAVTRDGEVMVLPASVALESPADPASSPRIVTLAAGSPDVADAAVVVIADDGPQWFRLRSLTIRGMARALGDRTYRVVPERTVAWDYGSLREVPSTPDGPPDGKPTPRRPPVADADDVDGATPFSSPRLDAALRASRVMILASRSAKGTPFAVPLWFVTHRGRLYATTSASSWTVRNVRAAPHVALLFGGEGGGDASRLVVRGHAAAFTRMPPPVVLTKITWRYYLHPRFAAVELRHARQWALRFRYYGQSRPAYLVITPLGVTDCRAPE